MINIHYYTFIVIKIHFQFLDSLSDSSLINLRFLRRFFSLTIRLTIKLAIRSTVRLTVRLIFRFIRWTWVKIIINKILHFILFYYNLHSSKSVYGWHFLFALITESNIISNKNLYDAFSFGIFLPWKFVFTLSLYYFIFVFIYWSLWP